MHDAIRMVRQGRGYGIADVPVIDIGRMGKGTVWHIVEGDAPHRAICGRQGRFIKIELGLDVKIILFRQQPVCWHCRNALGEVPMPELVRESDAS